MDDIDIMCRKRGRGEETGARVCIEGEKLGRHFGSWEEVGNTRRIFRKVRKELPMTSPSREHTYERRRI